MPSGYKRDSCAGGSSRDLRKAQALDRRSLSRLEGSASARMGFEISFIVEMNHSARAINAERSIPSEYKRDSCCSSRDWREARTLELGVEINFTVEMNHNARAITAERSIPSEYKRDSSAGGSSRDWREARALGRRSLSRLEGSASARTGYHARFNSRQK